MSANQSAASARPEADNESLASSSSESPEALAPDAFSDLLSVDDVPSFSSGSSIDRSSIDTGLASAVSGVKHTFNEETHQPTAVAEAPLLCRFDYLNCPRSESTGTHFHSENHWVEHQMAHFLDGGPPPKGASCRFCEFKVTPDDLRKPEILAILRRHDQLPEGDWPMADYDITRAQREASRARTTAFKNDMRVYSQAKALWYLLHRHVKGHYKAGYSNAAVNPDFEMYRHLYDVKVIDAGQYKRLSGGLANDEGVVSMQGGGREERRKR